MNARRGFMRAMACVGWLVAMPVWAQLKPAPGRLPKIGYLVLQPLFDPPSRERQAFLDGLRDLGYIPGKTVEIVYASAEGDEDFLDSACKELLARKVDLIVTSGSQPSLAAKAATKAVPIITLALGDPVGIGAVKSLARPGGNITGISFLSTDLAGKRLQLLKELIPSARRIAIVWNPRNVNADVERKAAIAASKTLGFRVVEVPVRNSSDIDQALKALGKARIDALYVTFDGGLIAESRTMIVQHAIEQRVPLVSGWTFMTDGGGLFSYAPDIPGIFRRSASYVHRVLNGTPPGDLPIEMPTKVEFVVNLKTARAIGVSVPQAFLLRADRVVD